MLNDQRVPLVSRSFLLHGSLAENMWIFRRLKRAEKAPQNRCPSMVLEACREVLSVSCEVNPYGSCETQTASFLSQIPHVWGPWNLHFDTYLIISTSYMLIYTLCIYIYTHIYIILSHTSVPLWIWTPPSMLQWESSGSASVWAGRVELEKVQKVAWTKSNMGICQINPNKQVKSI